ncbi:MAG: glycosyltransferase [Cytophagales bacterium]|nr:MAG: glycosyltransferase [Cytophagales bacterium]
MELVSDNNIIIHVSEVLITQNGGMGRVEWNWKHEFETRGFQFIHIGPKEIGKIKHPSLFPYKAYQYFKKLNIKPLFAIVHEPAGGVFVNKSFPVFIESHGIEQRYWELLINDRLFQEKTSWKTKLLFPLWRLRNCNKGLKQAQCLLLINNEDKVYAMNRFKISEKNIFIFRNGVNISNTVKSINTIPKIIFNASWINRKGVKVLVEAAVLLKQKGLNLEYLLMGTGKSADEVLKDWPLELHSSIEVISSFDSKEEQNLLSRADIFVLPSYYEGQPLSLLQAMAVGLCCITTNCCGQKDIINHGENGFLFERGNVAQFVELIEKCLSNKTLIEIIGNNAKQSMQERTWEKINKELVDEILNRLGN